MLVILFLLATVYPPVQGFALSVFYRAIGAPVDAAARFGCLWWAIAATVQAVVDGASGQWGTSLCAAANAGIGAWLWWRRRKRRDRAPRAYGAKSKARIAALVRKARQAARPRPVLRPVPGGAR